MAALCQKNVRAFLRQPGNARKLGSLLPTQAMARCHELSFAPNL